jgi:hypothetical protein
MRGKFLKTFKSTESMTLTGGNEFLIASYLFSFHRHSGKIYDLFMRKFVRYDIFC